MIDDDTRARALAQVQGMDKEYADGWKEGDDSTGAQAAADAGVAAGKKMDADPDFNFDEPGTATSTPVKAAQVMAEPIEPAKPMNFKETFAARRKAGDSTFEWNGKKYTTDLKGKATTNDTSPGVNASPAAAKPAPAAISAPAASTTVKYKPSAPVDTPEMVRSAPVKSAPSRGNASPATPGKLVAMPTLPDEQAPEMFNQPGGTKLSGGKDRYVAPVAAEVTTRRGYKS